jgi:NAD(P)-dependent dehydrogenase (short-subunit alcohol dehydrogenase family)
MFGMPAVYDGFLENTPMGRNGTTDDVAAVAVFLASDESSWLTGDNIFIDGGGLTKRYPDVLKIFTGG